jgi:hypothetical protein
MFLKVSRPGMHGLGWFTTRAAGDVVARDRMLVFPPEQTEPLLRTKARNYAEGSSESAARHQSPRSTTSNSRMRSGSAIRSISTIFPCAILKPNMARG